MSNYYKDYFALEAEFSVCINDSAVYGFLKNYEGENLAVVCEFLPREDPTPFNQTVNKVMASLRQAALEYRTHNPLEGEDAKLLYPQERKEIDECKARGDFKFLVSQKVSTLTLLERQIPNLSQIFHLRFIGSGLTRLVFKEKGSRTVIKITTDPKANRGEYSLYKAFEGTGIGSLLAECYEISNDGRVLEQEYISKKIPAKIRDSMFAGSKHWKDLVEELEGCFKFVKNYTKEKWLVCDFHDENMRVTTKNQVKLIDYSTLLSSIFANKNLTVGACISRLKAYTRRHDQKVSFELDDGKLVLRTLKNIQKLGQ